MVIPVPTLTAITPLWQPVSTGNATVAVAERAALGTSARVAVWPPENLAGGTGRGGWRAWRAGPSGEPVPGGFRDLLDPPRRRRGGGLAGLNRPADRLVTHGGEVRYAGGCPDADGGLIGIPSGSHVYGRTRPAGVR
jgi:hypothetical protein